MKQGICVKRKRMSFINVDRRRMIMPVLLLAVGILAAGMPAVTGCRIAPAQGADIAGPSPNGVLVATDFMERLLGLPYDAVWLDDSDRDGVGGLADIQANADFAESMDNFKVYWNIAENQLVNGSKTICLIVVPENPEEEGRYELQVVKTS